MSYLLKRFTMISISVLNRMIKRFSKIPWQGAVHRIGYRQSMDRIHWSKGVWALLVIVAAAVIAMPLDVLLPDGLRLAGARQPAK